MFSSPLLGHHQNDRSGEDDKCWLDVDGGGGGGGGGRRGGGGMLRCSIWASR